MNSSGNFIPGPPTALMSYPFPMQNQLQHPSLMERPYLNPMPTHFQLPSSTFSNPRPIIPTPKSEKRKQEPLTCDACGIEVNSQQMMDAHIRGQKHIKKLKLKTASSTTPTINQSLESTSNEQNSSTSTIEQPTSNEPNLPPPPPPSLPVVNKPTSSNDKSVLQTLNELAKFHKIISKYDLIKETGPAHCKQFEVRLTLGNEIYHGTGTSIKRAQQIAAEQALATTTLKKPESAPRGSRAAPPPPPRPNPPHEIPLPPPPSSSSQTTFPLINRQKSIENTFQTILNTKTSEIVDNPVRIDQIQQFVDDIERTLKTVSDKLMEQAKQDNRIVTPNLPDNVKLNNIEQDTEDPTESFRMLKGAMKVSILAMRLFYKYDQEYSLVLICANKPTVRLLNEIAQELTIGLNAQAIAGLQLDSTNDKAKPMTYQVETNISQAYLTIQCNHLSPYRIKMLLTSPVFRTENFLNIDELTREQIALLNPDPDDMLNKTKCLEAAAEIRHSNWFTRCMMDNPTNTLVIRLLRHLQYHKTPLVHLNIWCLTLIVNKCQIKPIHSLAYLFRSVFACLSSGILLSNQIGLGIIDPCEKELVDAAAYLSLKQRLDITNYANYILRLIAFEKYEMIFDFQNDVDEQIETHFL